MFMLKCLEKLDNNVKEYYLNSDEDTILKTLNIGYNVITSNQYINISDQNTSNLIENINNLEQELNNERNKYIELEKKKNDDNRLAIEIALEKSMEHANKNIQMLEEQTKILNTEKNEIRELLNGKEQELNELKCKMSTSKTKGEITEQNIRDTIESNGYRCEKPGNHAGDLWVYNDDKLVCILEIKNYGEENKAKLGINGSETKKMYNDIETQLNSDNTINVPWIFISMGCDIPNVENLRKTHLGVKCVYLSIPTSKELLSWIDFCEIINTLKSSKNDVNIIYIQQKINEIEEIFSNLMERRPNFKILKDYVNKLSNNVDKEEKKYNKLLEDSVKRMNEINKSIMIDNKLYDEEIDLMLNIDEMSYNKTKEYVKMLQSYSLNLFEKINNEKINIEKYETMDISNEVNIVKVNNNIIPENIITQDNENKFPNVVTQTIIEEKEEKKIKCNICGVMVLNLKRHQKTNKCKNFSNNLIESKN